jgi:hypothetical protein
MSIVDVAIPQQTRTRKTRFSDADVAAAVKLIKAKKAATLSESFTTRSDAQVAGFYLRAAVAEAMKIDAKGNLRSRTWQDGDSFRASVQAITPSEDKPAET